MFYPLGKNSEKPYGGGGGELASPLPVRPRVKLLCDKFKDSLFKIGKNEISIGSPKSLH